MSTTQSTTTTQPITWTPGISGRWTELNGYKISDLKATKLFVVEPLWEDGLPFLKAQATATARTLDEAIEATRRPYCPRCGHTVVAGAYLDPTLPSCPSR